MGFIIKCAAASLPLSQGMGFLRTAAESGESILLSGQGRTDNLSTPRRKGFLSYFAAISANSPSTKDWGDFPFCLSLAKSLLHPQISQEGNLKV